MIFMDMISAFFIGLVCGAIAGIFIMAIVVASGEGRRDTE